MLKKLLYAITAFTGLSIVIVLCGFFWLVVFFPVRRSNRKT